MPSKIIPVDDRLLVEEIQEKTDFALPEGAIKDKPRIGKVLDIGKQAEKYWKDLKGKTILFERYGPLNLKDQDEKLFLVRKQYVLAIIEHNE